MTIPQLKPSLRANDMTLNKSVLSNGSPPVTAMVIFWGLVLAAIDLKTDFISFVVSS